MDLNCTMFPYEAVLKSYMAFFDDENSPSTDVIALKLFFKFVKCYYICLSIVSMFSILYFVIHCRGYMKFNLNIKILIYFQFCSCFVHSAILGIFQTHHLITTIVARQPADLILSPYFYKFCYIPFVLSLFFTCSAQVIMIGDRTIASYFFEFYEKMSTTIGVTSIILTLVLPSFVFFLITYNVEYDFPTITVLSTPPTAVLKINFALSIFIIFYIFMVFHSIRLYRFNKEKNGSSRSQTSLGLSSKYQMSKNLISSRLLWQSSFAQTAIYLVYAVCLFFIRLYIPRPKPPFWIVITEFCYTPPIYCAVMPLLCIYTIRKSQNERERSIISIVSIRSTGTEGWDNYQRMLNDQWAVRPTMTRKTSSPLS